MWCDCGNPMLGLKKYHFLLSMQNLKNIKAPPSHENLLKQSHYSHKKNPEHNMNKMPLLAIILFKGLRRGLALDKMKKVKYKTS
jgi:hypothetical protein